MEKKRLFAAVSFLALVGAMPVVTSQVGPANAATCTVAAAGDVAGADDYKSGAASTAAQIRAAAPAAVIALGDLAYDNGTSTEFSNYYDPTWGSFKSITKPTPGNHEYNTGGASGYYSYFNGVSPNYAFDQCGWRFVSVATGAGINAAASFITQQAAANPGKPLAVFWHEPRYSSGSEHGSDPTYQPLWAAAANAGAKIVLNGHDHNYERFAEMDANGQAKAGGTREFVSGNGGHHPRSMGTTVANSQKRVAGTAGVLFLTLRSDGYDWKYQDVKGVVGDTGATNFGSGTTSTTRASTTTTSRPATTTTVAPKPPTSGVIRINAGGPAYVDSAGNTWEADRSFVGGNSYSVTNAISSTADQKLYQSERWGMTGYNIGVSNGTKTVRLKFAEISPASGQRIMSVTAESQPVISDLDIAAAVGNYKALDKTFTVTVNDGVLNLGFTASANSPKVAAIEVMPAVTTSTTSSSVPVTTTLPTNASIIRINSGGSAYVDPAGLRWDADRNYVGGSTYSVSNTISGTVKQDLYKTERWGMSAYKIPATNGSYSVKLRFAEISPASGTRVMSVTAEGKTVISNLNVAALVGNYTAYSSVFTSVVSDGYLDLGFSATSNSPKISAIEAVPVASNSPSTTSTTRPSSTSTTVGPLPTTAGLPVAGTWQQIFDDEFNGTSIDMGRWNLNEGKTQNAVTNRASNVSVSGGSVVLTLASSNSGAMISSGAVDGVGTNKFLLPVNAYAEARVYFPGSGTTIYNWPAWWSVGSNWPSNGENDIAEGLGTMTLNYHSSSANFGYRVPGTWSNAYHVYGIHRKADASDIYYDGVLVKTYATSDPDVGQALVFNVGNGYGPAVYGVSSQVKVDWVRAYKPA